MSEQVTSILKRKLEDLANYGGLDAETQRNALKEELQYYVLNFIYHHPEYSDWIMYGGSALRIIHELDRMSVDLDFEVAYPVTDKFLEDLKKEIDEHFADTYGTDSDFLSIKIAHERGLLLKFNVGEELSFSHPSKQVHVKIDLNYFSTPKGVTIERIPINHSQLSFVIKTYSLSALMASKLVAIFLRGTRGVGEAIYEEKGRDIYDLLWYMNKKVVPDFDYISAKDIDIKDPRVLFDKLTIQINKVNGKNIKQDLEPLFLDKNYIRNWLKNWRESYLRLLDEYKIRDVKELERCEVFVDVRTDDLLFRYKYLTDHGEDFIGIFCKIKDERGLPQNFGLEVDPDLNRKISFENGANKTEQRMQLAQLFLQKIDRFFAKNNRIIVAPKDKIETKIIRMTADNLNQKEQIVLNKSALLSCELDDLLK